MTEEGGRKNKDALGEGDDKNKKGRNRVHSLSIEIGKVKSRSKSRAYYIALGRTRKKIFSERQGTGGGVETVIPSPQGIRQAKSFNERVTQRSSLRNGHRTGKIEEGGDLKCEVAKLRRCLITVVGDCKNDRKNGK